VNRSMERCTVRMNREVVYEPVVDVVVQIELREERECCTELNAFEKSYETTMT